MSLSYDPVFHPKHERWSIIIFWVMVYLGSLETNLVSPSRGPNLQFRKHWTLYLSSDEFS